jgi:hypothetical protein
LYLTVTYSYLILPLIFLITKSKLKDRIPLILATYSLIVFTYLVFYYETPRDIRKYLQASYTFFEYSVFSYIFFYNIRSRVIKTFIITASILFIVFQVYFVSITTHKRLDSIPIGIETILLFIYIFFFFYEYSRNIKESFIYNHYGFWIAVGILIYLGGSLFFYILINQLTQDEVNKFGNLTYIAEIIKNILFAISIIIYKKYPTDRIQKNPVKIPNLDMI